MQRGPQHGSWILGKYPTGKDLQRLTHLEVHRSLFFDNGSLLQFFFGVHLPGFFGLFEALQCDFIYKLSIGFDAKFRLPRFSKTISETENKKQDLGELVCSQVLPVVF